MYGINHSILCDRRYTIRRDNKKKTSMAQIKRKLKEIPISWTKEEIMEEYVKYDRWIEKEDRNIQYEELRRSLMNIMNFKFKNAKALLEVGKGRGCYFVSKDRLKKYCQVIRAIFNMEKKSLGEKEVCISKAVLRERIYGFLQNEEAQKEIFDLPDIRGELFFSTCGLLNGCYDFEERVDCINQNVHDIELIGDDLLDTIIVNRKMDWYNGLDILFPNDSVSWSEFFEIIERQEGYEKWREAVVMDMNAYTDEKYEADLCGIHKKCNRIRGIRLDNMIDADKEIIRQEILEGNNILEYYIDILEDEKTLKTQTGKGDMENNRLRGAIIYQPAMEQFSTNLKKVKDLTKENPNLWDECCDKLVDWLNRFCYITEQIADYRKQEREADRNSESKKRMKKENAGDLMKKFKDQYDNPKQKLGINIPDSHAHTI